MKIILALSFCALFCAGVFAQAEEKQPSDVGVKEISLMRAAADASGKLSDAVTEFLTTDVPIYCEVRLASTKAVAVKMNLVAASAAGLRANQTVVSVNFKTDGKSDGVTFDVSPNGKTWAAGKYRVDILLDGKLARSLEFEIKKSSKETEKEKPPPPSPPAKSKPKTKPRKIENALFRRAPFGISRAVCENFRKAKKGEHF